jgi:uncharacterized damage-inducible protein DinB
MTTDPRYPIGRFQRGADPTAAEREALIDDIRALPARLRAAVAGLSESELDTPYRPGGWTVRQLVHHVTDSHLHSYTRFKFAATEDRPTIKPYDENVWAGFDDARRLPVEASLSVLDGLHARWVAFLESLSDEAFARPIVHPQTGEWTIGGLLALYAWHGRHHTAHIVQRTR